MLRRNFANKDFQRTPKEELRYLFYLSRNNAWVSMGDELVKLNIHELIETTSRHEGTTTHFGKKLHAVDEHHNSELKYLFSQILNYLSISCISHSFSQIEAKGHPTLPPLNLDISTLDMLDVTIFKDSDLNEFKNIADCISVHALLNNYDALFMQHFNELPQAEKEKAIAEYAATRKVAFDDAFKNAVWLAVASGDNKQLALLLAERSNFDIQSTYKGKNLIQAMFTAEREDIRPFLNKTPDYPATIALLLSKGFSFDKPIASNNQRTSRDVCLAYKEAQASKWIFQTKNEFHLMLINEMEKALGKKFESESTYADGNVARFAQPK